MGVAAGTGLDSLKTALVVSFAFAMNAVIKNDRAPEMRDQLGAVCIFYN